jgi:uncharacterized protein (DUF2147 family)
MIEEILKPNKSKSKKIPLFRVEKVGTWENGEIYDPKSGKTYSCVMKLESADKLSIRGYMGISLIGRSEVWTRVK